MHRYHHDFGRHALGGTVRCPGRLRQAKPRRFVLVSLTALLLAGVCPVASIQGQVAGSTRPRVDLDQAIGVIESGGSPEQRMQAADILGRKGYRRRTEITPLLRRALLGDRDARVRASAGRALGRLGSRAAVPDLVRALSDASPDVRVVAAAALWRLPDPSSVEALTRVTSDADVTVREWAAMALGVSGDTRATAPLVRLLDDSSSAVRLVALRGLGKLQDPTSLPALRAYALQPKIGGEEFQEVVIALSSLRGSSKVNVLVGLLRKFADDETRQIEVVRALGRVGDALVLPALRRARSGARSSRLRAQLQEAEANVEKRIQEKASTR